MLLTVFFELYKIFIRLHRCNLIVLAKNLFEKSGNMSNILLKFFQNKLQMLQDIVLSFVAEVNLQILPTFKKKSAR